MAVLDEAARPGTGCELAATALPERKPNSPPRRISSSASPTSPRPWRPPASCANERIRNCLLLRLRRGLFRPRANGNSGAWYQPIDVPETRGSSLAAPRRSKNDLRERSSENSAFDNGCGSPSPERMPTLPSISFASLSCEVPAHPRRWQVVVALGNLAVVIAFRVVPSPLSNLFRFRARGWYRRRDDPRPRDPHRHRARLLRGLRRQLLVAWSRGRGAAAMSHGSWATIKESAVRRLGKPLLLAYLLVFFFALIVVAGALLASASASLGQEATPIRRASGSREWRPCPSSCASTRRRWMSTPMASEGHDDANHRAIFGNMRPATKQDVETHTHEGRS